MNRVSTPPNTFRRGVAACAALICLAAVPAGSDEPLGRITLVATDVPSEAGQVLVSLHDSAADYASEVSAFRIARVPIVAGQAVVAFDALPHGDYAIKIFHDANGNEKLDTNFMGVPTEAYGFSNDARGRFGPPSFEAARFRLEAAELELAVRLQRIF